MMASEEKGGHSNSCSSPPEVTQYHRAFQPQTDRLIEERAIFSTAEKSGPAATNPNDGDNLITGRTDVHTNMQGSQQQPLRALTMIHSTWDCSNGPALPPPTPGAIEGLKPSHS